MSANRAFTVLILAATLATALTILLARDASANHTTFTVTRTNDFHDADPGDGVCRSPSIPLPGLPGSLPGACTLRAAVEEANAHPGSDTIVLAAASYDLDFGSLIIDSTVRIRGAGDVETVIDAQQSNRVFDVLPAASLSIEQLAVTGGLDTNGAGITNSGVLVIDNARIYGNEAQSARGGGIWNRAGATLTLVAASVDHNVASQQGGGIWNVGTLNVTTSVISDNAAPLSGGGIHHAGGGIATLIGNVIFQNVVAGGDGGGIWNDGTLVMTSNLASNNTAGGQGGGIWNGGIASLTGCRVGPNNAAAGNAGSGGIANDSGSDMTLTNCTVRGNSASLTGAGGIANRGNLTITNSSVLENFGALDSGGIWNGPNATLTMIDSHVSNNTTNGIGGGIVNRLGTLTLNNTTVTGNRAVTDGGGIWNDGTLQLSTVTLDGNETGKDGAGLYNPTPGAVSIERSTIRANHAGVQGGGIYSEGQVTTRQTTLNGNTALVAAGAFNLGRLILTNSTVSGNVAAGTGGGIFSGNDAATSLTVQSSTIARNVAITGGGLNITTGGATIHNSIVAENTASDCAGAPTSLGTNIDGDGSCLVAPAFGDQPSTNPILGPLASNGGPTQTHALPIGSPAIDAGNPTGAPATDQRGLPRGNLPDIGAFEVQPADEDGDGFFSVETGGADCDDSDPSAHPGAPDTPYDGIDQDCDGDDLVDADGDGHTALQAIGGTPDCDDTDAGIHPGAVDLAGDDIDQNCDGADASVEVAQVFIAGWNTLVFTGDAVTAPDAIAASIGPRLDSLWLFQPALQTWLVHRPGALPILNTLVQVSPGDALFVRLLPGDPLSVTLPDALTATRVEILLLPGWTFIGYTGVDGALPADLIGGSQSIDALFAFHSPTQRWNGFFPGQPAFLNALTTIDRGMALFVHSTGADPITLTWDQVALSP